MFLRTMLGIPREIDTVMGLHCVRRAAFKLFFIVSPLFHDSGLRLATEGISAKAGRQKRALCCVRWEQVRRGAAALLPAPIMRCSPCGCGAAPGLHVLLAPPISSLDSVSLGSGACAALWCMVPIYPSPMASGLKAARDRCEFRGDFLILVFLRGFQFSPALPSFLPDCQLC